MTDHEIAPTTTSEEAAPTTPLTDLLMLIGPIMYFTFRYIGPYVGFALSFGIVILPTMIDLRRQFDAWWMQTPLYTFADALPFQPGIDPVMQLCIGGPLTIALFAGIFNALSDSLHKAR